MSKKKIRFKKDKVININPDGSEKLCGKPTELRAKILNPVSLRQKMKSYWAEFKLRDEESKSFESIKDGQDFDVSNDEFPKSPYEIEGELNDALDQSLAESEPEASYEPEANESDSVQSKEDKND